MDAGVRFELVALAGALAAAACGPFTDAATRLAYDIENGSERLGDDDGARYALIHQTPSRPGDCEGSYKVQLDDVGAIIIWCRDPAGAAVSSHSTSYHRRFVETARTFILDKPAGSPLTIVLERRRGRPVIVDVS